MVLLPVGSLFDSLVYGHYVVLPFLQFIPSVLGLFTASETLKSTISPVEAASLTTRGLA